MGLKINLMLVFNLFTGYFYEVSNSWLLIYTTFFLLWLHYNHKVWQFTRKFPGENVLMGMQHLFGCSLGELHNLWIKYRCDKFTTWVGLQQYIVVSKADDVIRVLAATDELNVVENLGRVWPWITADETHICSQKVSRALLRAICDDNLHRLAQSAQHNSELKRISANVARKDVKQMLFKAIQGNLSLH